MRSIARRFYYRLPPSLRFAARWLFFLPYDIFQSLFSPAPGIRPPRRLIYTGAGDFLKIGESFVHEFRTRGLVHPDSVVLDVGSGMGRLAIPLTTLLTRGQYEGFDIIKSGVRWCQHNISSTYPQFTFTHVALINDLYRQEGQSAGDFRFPYPDGYFDFVMVISVFTHMVPEEVDHYVREISRVLKNGGHLYATFFVLNEASRANMRKGQHEFDFKFDRGHYSLLDAKVKSANVAFEETYLMEQILGPAGLTVVSREYGTWSSQEKGNPIAFQDRITCQKTI